MKPRVWLRVKRIAFAAGLGVLALKHEDLPDYYQAPQAYNVPNPTSTSTYYTTT